MVLLLPNRIIKVKFFVCLGVKCSSPARKQIVFCLSTQYYLAFIISRVVKRKINLVKCEAVFQKCVKEWPFI